MQNTIALECQHKLDFSFNGFSGEPCGKRRGIPDDPVSEVDVELDIMNMDALP